MKKISGVIFDMDGLLFNTEAVYSKNNIEIAQRFNMPGYDEEYYKSEVGLGEKAVYEKYTNDFPMLEKNDVDQFFKESRESTWNEFNEKGAPLKPGVEELLTYLNHHDIACVVASSNNRVAIDLLLDKAQLTDKFKGIVSGDDVTHAKPHPEIVEKAVSLLGTPKKETIMLEDSLNGIRASFSAGVPVIMVPDLILSNDEANEKTLAVKDDLFAVLDYIKSN
ncbi:HAD family hydrolase [Vagococcus luciliae]|uniref:Phosphorylated carbohydrates phosphatase n=1 Tax=Vagococcus luciliae TaxID=2920380 RepID=A0ABY5NYF9_9ENTE|nr:HAD family phosphatase [Vagococcus luciliae]UUV98622.1 Phosphorylated carbohydrates phosphatase [Vagococcus luciliae]